MAARHAVTCVPYAPWPPPDHATRRYEMPNWLNTTDNYVNYIITFLFLTEVSLAHEKSGSGTETQHRGRVSQA